MLGAMRLFLALLLAGSAEADDKRRLDFAQMYVGGDLGVTPWAGDFAWRSGGVVQMDPLPASIAPSIAIGGLHFWRYSDFYVRIELPSVRLRSAPVPTFLDWGTETGARVYPWPLERDTVRPFAGLGWAVGAYSVDNGPTHTLHQAPAAIGLSWRQTSWAFDVYGMAALPLEVDDHVSRNTQATVPLQMFRVGLQARFLMDTTRTSTFGEAERRARYEREHRLSAFSVAVGPSSAFTLVSGDPGDGLDWISPPGVAIFPEVALGYYFHAPDLATRVAWRPITQRTSGFGATRTYGRQSVALEVFKMVGDYHGFVPFLGASAGLESLHYTARDNGTIVDVSDTVFAPTAVFGWDIRPSRTQPFLLRTNLRVAPTLSLDLPEGEASFRQLEFNFIQAVFYPERMFSGGP